jgi:hypothetical protein
MSLDLVKPAAALLQRLGKFFKHNALYNCHFAIQLTLLQEQKNDIYQLIAQAVNPRAEVSPARIIQ